MLFFRLLEISVSHPAKCKLPSIREICMCMLVYAYENQVLKNTMFLNITIFQTISVILLKACTPDFIHQYLLLTSTPLLFSLDAVYFRMIFLVLSVGKRVKINTCLITSLFGASSHKWSFQLTNVSLLELKSQQQNQSSTFPSS